MKKLTFRFAYLILIIIALTVTACYKAVTVTPLDPNLPSTKFVPQPGGMTERAIVLLAKASLQDYIRDSKIAFIGTVKEIYPSEFGEINYTGRRSIHTDVSIIPERYLFGGSNLSPQIVRVYGGRVGNITAIQEGEPTFTVTERVLVFASPYVYKIGSNSTAVLRVGDFRGKYRVEGNIAIQDFTNTTEQLSRIESLIAWTKH